MKRIRDAMILVANNRSYVVPNASSQWQPIYAPPNNKNHEAIHTLFLLYIHLKLLLPTGEGWDWADWDDDVVAATKIRGDAQNWRRSVSPSPSAKHWNRMTVFKEIQYYTEHILQSGNSRFDLTLRTPFRCALIAAQVARETDDENIVKRCDC